MSTSDTDDAVIMIVVGMVVAPLLVVYGLTPWFVLFLGWILHGMV